MKKLLRSTIACCETRGRDEKFYMVNTTHDFLAFAVSNCNLEESALGEITCIILSFRSIIQVDDHKNW